MWSKYPRRAGSNSRPDALKAWRARLADGVSVADMEAGVARYAAFAKATGKERTELVMQGQRFFGPGLHWAESWFLPAAAIMGSRPSKQEAGRAAMAEWLATQEAVNGNT